MIPTKTSRDRLGSPHPAKRNASDRGQTGRTILKTFGHLGSPVAHPAGSVLFREGERITGIYLVESGQIKLSCSAGQKRSVILRIARAGEILELSALLHGSSHETTGTTLTECDLIHIVPSAFLSFIHEMASACKLALFALSRDNRELLTSARRLALFPLASSRMAQVLIALSGLEECGKPRTGFSLPLTHSELASLIGTTRETVTRVLNELERQQVIVRSESFVKILKPSKLAQLAN